MATKKKLLQAAAGVSTGPEGAWDVSYAYYTGPNPYSLSNAILTATFSVSAQDGSPTGIFFKPDGTKMYMIGDEFNNVYEYNLSTAWDCSTASYVQSFSVSSQEVTPRGLFFKPDGTKMYITGSIGDEVNEYDLSTAWDISTLSFNQLFSVSSQDTFPSGLFFKPDGTKMYVLGDTGNDVNQYNLSTAWDVSTASYSQTFSVSSQGSAPRDLAFSQDGTYMFVADYNDYEVNKYTLSTAWDISTASYSESLDTSTFSTTIEGLYVKPDGLGLYVVDQTNLNVRQYVMGGFDVSTQEATPEGLFFKPDGTKMYVVGVVGDDVNEYDLSTAWDLTTASYVQNFSVSAQDTLPTGIFFKPDGTKMYISGDSGNDINEYTLSTAWDISTASYVQRFSINVQEGTVEDVFFKPDGTKMYIVGVQTDTVYEYDLSTAWDISSSTYNQGFNVNSQAANPKGLFFKDDGTKMYVIGISADSVFEYSLSTGWDVSTASYTQSIDIRLENNNGFGLFFKDDGTQMFIVDTNRDAVSSYTLGVQE